MAKLILGPIDELPQLRTYTTLLLGFPLVHEVDQARLMGCLQTAANLLVNHFPFLAGQVSHLEASREKMNAIEHIPVDGTPKVTVLFNDAKNDLPSYYEMREARAPASMLDGNIVGLGYGFPDRYSSGSTPNPCFQVKANFIKGGLLLVFSLIHTIGDGTSLGQVVKMFATACRGNEISKADLQAGSIDRQKTIPSLRLDQPQLDHSDMIVMKEVTEDHTYQKEAPVSRWAYLHFSKAMLAELKAEALADTLRDQETVLHVSTNDALTALIWRAFTLARLPRLQESTATMLLRVVNCRRKLDPPLLAASIQNVVSATYTSFSLQEFVTVPLSTIALDLRKDLQDLDDHHVRSLATFIRSRKDKDSVVFGASITPSDLVLSSLAELPIYTSDFGELLGHPEFVRRPTLTPTDGLVYYMPKTQKGDIDVAISIREDDMERLWGEEKLAYYSEFIG